MMLCSLVRVQGSSLPGLQPKGNSQDVRTFWRRSMHTFKGDSHCKNYLIPTLFTFLLSSTSFGPLPLPYPMGLQLLRAVFQDIVYFHPVYFQLQTISCSTLYTFMAPCSTTGANFVYLPTWKFNKFSSINTYLLNSYNMLDSQDTEIKKACFLPLGRSRKQEQSSTLSVHDSKNLSIFYPSSHTQTQAPQISNKMSSRFSPRWCLL